MGSIGNGVINTFVDGDIVSATGTSPALLRSALNPKMQIIQAANDDNDSRIGVLEGQVTAITGSVQYNVKAAPFNAVGNGIADDTAAIQAAITTASANKGVVVFPTGTYKITAHLTVAGNCILASDGAGGSAVIRQANSLRSVYITGGNVTIQDLDFDPQASTSSFSVIDNSATVASPHTNITIQRCNFYSTNASAFNAILVRSTTNASVKSCTITSPAPSAIQFTSCTASTISYNKITGGDMPITLWRTTGVSLATSPQCINCVVENNTISGATGNPIYAISPKNCIIRNNYVTSTNTNLSYAAVYLDSSTDGASTIYSYYNVISKNTVDNTGYVTNTCSALFLSYTYYTLVEGNIFNEVGYMTANASYSLNIVGNQFTNMLTGAISLGTSTGDVIISANGFTDMYASSGTTYAIRLNAVTNGRPITITGNSLYRGSKVATVINTYGTYAAGTVQDYSNFIVSGNSFNKNSSLAYYSTSSTVFCYYYEEPSGDRVFVSPSGSYPTAGTWYQGDKVLIQSPTAGGYIGYVCTTAGSPGTWKGYGAIQV